MLISINNIEDLVKIIKSRRKELNISQDELAKLSNLSSNGISKFESNPGDREIKISTLLKLSTFLGFKLKLELEE